MTDLRSEPSQSKVITTAEVKKHNSKENRVWMIIHDNVYDVTSFLEEHPGGEDTLLDAAGKEATQDFEDVGHSDDAREVMKKYLIGTLPDEEKSQGSKGGKPTSGHNFDPELRSNSRSRCALCGESSRSLEPVKTEYKTPTTPRPEGRVKAIHVPKERKRPEPAPRSNLKWAVIALAGAVVLGIILKKYLNK